HPAGRSHGVSGQIHLRALRHHRQRDPVRAGMGGHGDARDLEHDADSGQNLRERGHRASAVLSERRALPHVVSRQKGKISGASRGDAAEDLNLLDIYSVYIDRHSINISYTFVKRIDLTPAARTAVII